MPAISVDTIRTAPTPSISAMPATIHRLPAQHHRPRSVSCSPRLLHAQHSSVRLQRVPGRATQPANGICARHAISSCCRSHVRSDRRQDIRPCRSTDTVSLDDDPLERLRIPVTARAPCFTDSISHRPPLHPPTHALSNAHGYETCPRAHQPRPIFSANPAYGPDARGIPSARLPDTHCSYPRTAILWRSRPASRRPSACSFG